MEEVKIEIGRLHCEILRGCFLYMQIGYVISYGKT